MEKYSKWKDPATGIHPFLKPKPQRQTRAPTGSDKILKGLMSFLVGPVLFILRLPVVLLMLVLLPLVSVITMLIPVPIIKRALRRLLQGPLARIALFSMGYLWIPTSTVHPKQRTKTYTGMPGASIGSGDLIVCNYVSYIQAIYLCFRYSATFATISHTAGGAKGPMVAQCGLWGAMRDAVSDTQPSDSSLVPLAEVLESAGKLGNGPVVVFPEGTTSNGLEVLKFLPHVFVEGLLKTNPRVHIVGFKFEPTSEGLTGAYTVGWVSAHFYRTLAHPANTLSIHHCPTDAMPAELKPKKLSKYDINAHRTTEQKDVTEEMAITLAAVLGAHRAVTLGVAEKAEFTEYYGSHNTSKGYKKKR